MSSTELLQVGEFEPARPPTRRLSYQLSATGDPTNNQAVGEAAHARIQRIRRRDGAGEMEPGAVLWCSQRLCRQGSAVAISLYALPHLHDYAACPMQSGILKP
jgi:hypothetical protein